MNKYVITIEDCEDCRAYDERFDECSLTGEPQNFNDFYKGRPIPDNCPKLNQKKED